MSITVTTFQLALFVAGQVALRKGTLTAARFAALMAQIDNEGQAQKAMSAVQAAPCIVKAGVLQGEWPCWLTEVPTLVNNIGEVCGSIGV